MDQPTRPRGTRDWRGPDLEAHLLVEQTCGHVFERFGCERVRPPSFEDFALLESRYGAAIRERLFTFHADREYALRPDLTGPVARMVASGALDGAPLPYRLSYVGACWRYERSQDLRWREFRQAGVEFVGAPEGAADDELLDCALAVLEALGVTDVRVRLGHAGLLAGWLGAREDTAPHVARVLADLDALDRVRVRAADADPQWLAATHAALAARQRAALRFGPEAVPRALRMDAESVGTVGGAAKVLDVARATTRALWVLELGLPEALADRLLAVLAATAPDMEAVLSEALEVPCVRVANAELARAWGRMAPSWRAKAELAPGSVRGLAYYTGLTFELDAPAFGGQKQLCGGGRFDRMIGDLGGVAHPAAGFAFGVERLAAAMVRERALPARPRAVWVAAADDRSRDGAADEAARLRRAGVPVVTDLLGRTLAEQIGQASSMGARAVVIVGPGEGRAIRWLDERRQEAVGADELAVRLGAGGDA
ncbi:MAG: hypothetical protein AMXMBFR64_49780 [Myxococcales bacterium]